MGIAKVKLDRRKNELDDKMEGFRYRSLHVVGSSISVVERALQQVKSFLRPAQELQETVELVVSIR